MLEHLRDADLSERKCRMKNTGLPRVGWRRSTYSFSNGNCVEVAGTGTMIAGRDSQDRDGPQLVFAPERWAAFAAAVKATHQSPGRSRLLRSGPRP
jgi:hypothetical protein